MDSPLTAIGLPVALGIIMFGLGLSLTVQDFRNVQKHPKAVFIALACQMLFLPAVCFGLVLALDLSPYLGIGMMLLAASPGGTTANLYSHLFRGDVALNITLTAVNSIAALITMPLITNLAIAYYSVDNEVSLSFRKVLEVFAVVLVPVAIGMWVKSRSESFAQRMDKPVRIASAVILAIMIIGILAAERENVLDYAAQIGLATTLFCVISIAVGYYVPKMFGVRERQAVASSFEIGIHNATLAIYVAENALRQTEIAVPGAVYGLIMFFIAAGWGFLLTRVLQKDPAPA